MLFDVFNCVLSLKATFSYFLLFTKMINARTVFAVYGWDIVEMM